MQLAIRPEGSQETRIQDRKQQNDLLATLSGIIGLFMKHTETQGCNKCNKLYWNEENLRNQGIFYCVAKAGSVIIGGHYRNWFCFSYF